MIIGWVGTVTNKLRYIQIYYISIIILLTKVSIFEIIIIVEASRGVGAQSVAVKWVGCGFEEMKYLFKFTFPFLRWVVYFSDVNRNVMSLQIDTKYLSRFFFIVY